MKKKLSVRLSAVLLCLCIILTVCSCGAKKAEFTSFAMGSRVMERNMHGDKRLGQGAVRNRQGIRHLADKRLRYGCREQIHGEFSRKSRPLMQHS